MAQKSLTASEAAELIAAKSGTTLEQAKAVLQAQAELAYAHVAQGFPIPGLGKLILTESPARKIVMQFGPKAGQEIAIPEKRKLSFRISHIASGAVFSAARPIPDLFRHYAIDGEFQFSTEATELRDPSPFLSTLGDHLPLRRDHSLATLIVHELANFNLISGQIEALDPMIGANGPFTRTVPAGRYPLGLVVARIGTDERIALAILRFSSSPVVRWELAVTEKQKQATAQTDRPFGYGVDSGTGCFCDAAAQQLMQEFNEADTGLFERIIDEMKPTYKFTRSWTHITTRAGSIAVFSSGYGDGYYSSYFGLDAAGKAVTLVTDFGIVDWNHG